MRLNISRGCASREGQRKGTVIFLRDAEKSADVTSSEVVAMSVADVVASDPPHEKTAVDVGSRSFPTAKRMVPVTVNTPGPTDDERDSSTEVLERDNWSLTHVLRDAKNSVDVANPEAVMREETSRWARRK
jgi:hypothetical protein